MGGIGKGVDTRVLQGVIFCVVLGGIIKGGPRGGAMVGTRVVLWMLIRVM